MHVENSGQFNVTQLLLNDNKAETNVEHGINTFFILNIECIDKYEKDTGDSEKSPSSSNRSRTYDLLVTIPDALPLSYRRLLGAKAIKLGSCDKRPAYC